MTKPNFLVQQLALAISLFSTILLSAPHAQAQGRAGQLLVRSCSAPNYPSVSCVLVPIDASGKPIPNLPATAFEVNEGTSPAKELMVSEGTNPDASTSTMWVVDMSGNLGARYVDDVRKIIGTSFPISPAKPLNELVGMIALTGKIEMPATADNIPLNEQRESGFSNDANRSLANKIAGLTAQASLPLHDGVFKAILLTRNQPIGTRAIVVLTDGFGRTSDSAAIARVVNEAQNAGIPIYTFGLGAALTNAAETEKLKSLSVATGGEYAPATNPSAVAAAYRVIQERLKVQYTLAFTAPSPEKADRNFTFKLNLPDRKVDAADYLVKPTSPEIPVIKNVRYLSGGSPIQPNQLPAETVAVELTVDAQTISQVQYQLDGGDVVVGVVGGEGPTYTFNLRAGSLEPGSTHTLLIKVFGAADKPDQVTEQTEAITIAGAPAPAATEPPVVATPAPAPQPTPASFIDQIATSLGMDALMLGALALGLLALLVLSALIISSIVRRRRQSAAPVTDVMASPFSPSGGFANPTNFPTNSGFNLNPITPISTISTEGGQVNDDPTQVFVDKGSESQPTQVLQSAKAMLEVMSGPTQGDRIPLGVPGKTIVVIGRDADPLVGDLQLKSTFVSRKHAEIHLEGDEMFLMDLGSSSGTKLNGQKLKPNEKQKFDVGAEISFADVKTKVSQPD